MTKYLKRKVFVMCDEMKLKRRQKSSSKSLGDSGNILASGKKRLNELETKSETEHITNFARNNRQQVIYCIENVVFLKVSGCS